MTLQKCSQVSSCSSVRSLSDFLLEIIATGDQMKHTKIQIPLCWNISGIKVYNKDLVHLDMKTLVCTVKIVLGRIPCIEVTVDGKKNK